MLNRTALRRALGALVLPCALVTSNLLADQAITTPFKDTTIFSEGDYSSGQGNSLFVGATYDGYLRRALIAFPVLGYVPPGSTIESAKLTIWLTKSNFGGSATLHRIYSNWGEAGSDSGSSGMGDFAQQDDATWDYRFIRFFNPLEWNTPGGDFEPIASSSQTFAASLNVTEYSFPSTPRMVADVQHWLDVGGNFGWEMIGDETRPSAIRFDSRDGFFYDTLPILTITFTPPDQPQWNVDAGGTWGDANNWVGGVPNSSTAIANFLGKITAPRTITLDGDRTVGAMNFNSVQSYTIAPGSGGQLTFGGSGSGISLTSDAGSHTISAKVLLAGPGNIAVAANSALTLSGGLEISAFQTITKAGAGLLTISGPQTHQSFASLYVTGGQVALNSNAGAPATASDPASTNLSLTVANDAALVTLGASQDLYALSVNYFDNNAQGLDLASTATEFHAVRVYGNDLDYVKTSLNAAIANAKNNPGDGIFDSGLHLNSAIGVAKLVNDHGDPYVLMRPTRKGDLNLDGVVTIADFIDLASHFNQSGAWQEGDVNGDGAVTIADFIDLASNFNQGYAGGALPISASDQQTLESFAAAHGVTLVPEPAALGLALLGSVCLRSRRR